MKTRWTVWQYIKGKEGGTSIVEFAITIPVLILVFMGIFDLGRAFFVAHALSQLAREGARYAIVNSDNTAAIVQYVKDHAVGVDPDQLNVTVTYPETHWIRVAVSYDFYPVTPLITQFLGGSDHVTLSSATEMRIEK